MTAAFQILQKSLLEARKDLDSTNESIKKITGFDAKQRSTPRSGSGSSRNGGPESNRRLSGGPDISRRLSSSDSRPERSRSGGNLRAWSGSSPADGRKRERPGEGRSRLGGRLGSSGDLDLSESKRRDPFGAKSRLAGRLGPPVNWEEKKERVHDLDSEGEEDGEIVDGGSKKHPPVQSSVVAMAAPPRPKADPNEDEQSKKRNRRMFGFLMNTLRTFKDKEATAKTSDKERRRSELEDKVQKTAEIEREAAEQERKELFDQKKAQKNKIDTIAKQMELVNNYTEWNEHDRKLQGYIETRAKPHIYYLPKEHTAKTEELVGKTKQKIEEKIDKRLKEIDSFLETANSLKSEIPKSDGPVRGEGGEDGGGRESDSGEASGSN